MCCSLKLVSQLYFSIKVITVVLNFFFFHHLGSSIGSALTYPLCGYIIDAFGWEMAFYVCGVIGTVWFIAWYFLVFDSPQQHPRISQKEKDYILDSLGKSVSKKNVTSHWPKFVQILANKVCVGADSLETPFDIKAGMD